MPAAELYKLSESDDPTKAMRKQIGDLSCVHVAGGRLLVWTYIRPRKTKGGIILTDKEVREDLFQGTVGYVLKRGPLAFADDSNSNFAGFEAVVGDWVVYTPGEGKRIQINGVDCRIIEDALIAMTIPDPEFITHRQ